MATDTSQEVRKLDDFYGEDFYEGQVTRSLNSARVYLPYLWNYLQPKSVLDVGCGRGTWLKVWHELGCQNLLGFDGPWNSQPKMLDPAVQFKSIDLNEPFSLPAKVDLAMTLEVAEHLKASKAEQFVQCLTNAADTVLFSAAFTGQGGANHINEQPHSYWAEFFLRRDYAPFDLFRPALWDQTVVCYWYRQNTFLYLRKGSPAYQKVKAAGGCELTETRFMNCIHPELYAKKSGIIGFSDHLRDLIPSFCRAIRKRI